MADTRVFEATVAAINRPPNPPNPVQLDKLHELLMTPGVDVDLPGGCHSNTPLCTAVEEGSLVVVKLLLEHGADPHAFSGESNEIAIHTAVNAYCTFEDKRSIIFELIAHNANINACTHKGLTALQMACSLGEIKLLMLLLDLGARIDAVTRKGETACAYRTYFNPIRCKRPCRRPQQPDHGKAKNAATRLPTSTRRNKRKADKLSTDEDDEKLPV
jgi:hypothetical protein